MKITTNVNNKLERIDVERASKFKYEGTLTTLKTKDIENIDKIFETITNKYEISPTGYVIVVHPDLLFNAPWSYSTRTNDLIKLDTGHKQATIVSSTPGVQFANPTAQREHHSPALLPFLAHFTQKVTDAEILNWHSDYNIYHINNPTNINTIPSWNNTQLKTMLSSKLDSWVIFEFVDTDGEVKNIKWHQQLRVLDILVAMSQGNIAYSYDINTDSLDDTTIVAAKTAKTPFHLVKTLKGYRWILGSNYVFNRYYEHTETTIRNKLVTIVAQLNELSDQIELTEFSPGSAQTEHFLTFNHWGTDITTPLVSYILKPKYDLQQVKKLMGEYEAFDEEKFSRSLDILFEDFFGKNIRVNKELIPYIVKIVDEKGLDVTTSTTIFPIK